MTAVLGGLCTAFAGVVCTVPSKRAKNVERSKMPKVFVMLDSIVMLDT